jgi:homoserine kinase type II
MLEFLVNMEQVGKKDKLRKKEILAATDFFGLGKVLSQSFIKAGNINSNYVLRTNKGKYILRAYKFKIEEEILCELELLNFLSRKGFPCPAPVGAIYKTANKYVCCFKFIEGRVPKRITLAMLREIAKLLAQLHILARNYRTKYFREGEGLEVVKKYLENKKRFILESRFKDSKNFIGFLEAELNKLSFDKNLPHGAVHVDVKLENVIVEKDGSLHFIDFDNFYFDSFMMDIVSAVMWLCEEGEKINLRKAKAFLLEYNRHRRITKAEMCCFADYAKFHCLKGVFKYAYICLPRLKFAERWAYHFIRVYKNIGKQDLNFEIN